MANPVPTPVNHYPISIGPLGDLLGGELWMVLHYAGDTILLYQAVVAVQKNPVASVMVNGVVADDRSSGPVEDSYSPCWAVVDSTLKDGDSRSPVVHHPLRVEVLRRIGLDLKPNE